MRYARILALIPWLMLGTAPTLSNAAVDVSVSVNFAPPVIPVYEQPPLPQLGYLWTPGYWAWDGMDYYWVPGTWVLPPVNGYLWTPGYWGWRDGLYLWNTGYWGPEVGFYGGIDYGFGYTGHGYLGGYWHGGAFFYNRAVANFGQVRVVNVYTAPAPHWGASHVSFNGGQGGVRAQPSAAERIAMNQHRGGPTALQREHEQHARAMPGLHAAQNGGRPQIFTTQRPADFAHPGPGLHNHQATAPNRSGSAMHGPALHAGAQPPAAGGRPSTGQGLAPPDTQQLHTQPAREAQPFHSQAPRPQVQHEPQHEPPREAGPRPPQAMHEQGPRPPQQHEGPREAPHDAGRHDEPGHRNH